MYYDCKSFEEAVKNFPDFPLTKKDFQWLFDMVSHDIWLNLEMRDCIPKGKDWNMSLSKFFVDTLNKFLKENNQLPVPKGAGLKKPHVDQP